MFTYDGHPDHILLTGPDGIIRACDPRAWLLWIYAVHHGIAYRTSEYGVETWDYLPNGAYMHFTVHHAVVGTSNESVDMLSEYR